MIADLIRSNRSCRRFEQNYNVSSDTLMALTDLGRLSASARNLQPLKYVLSCDTVMNARIFECLSWAGYLTDWPGPADGERPAAYIVVLHDTRISSISNPIVGCDHGIAAQSILLGAREQGLAGCMIAAINRPKLSRILDIADHFKILMVLAIGKPKEKVVLETVKDQASIRYWRDDQQVHHVPKRSLSNIVIAVYS